MHKEIGIDLGSANILVSTAEEGIIAKEAAVAAIDRESNRLQAIGAAAEQCAQETAKSVVLVRPLRSGILADAEATRAMLLHAIRETCGNLVIKPRVLIGVPFDLTEEGETLLEWTAARAGARETFFVYTPIAARVGLGLLSDSAVLIADIGASQTNLMLSGGGKVLYKKTVKVGGDAFDNAISAYLLEKYQMKINARSAETIKLRIGTVWINREERMIDVKGKHVGEGKAVTVHLSSREMFDAFEEPMAQLIAAFCDAISAIPSAYVGEVFHRGILLCGGACQLDGLDKMISGVTGVNTRVVERPDEVVADGLAKILADLPTAMKNEKINVSALCMRADWR